MKSKLNLFLKSFNNSVLVTTKGSYGGKWPMPFFTSLDVGMVIGKYWGDFFIEVIRKLQKRINSINEIVQKVKYPSPFSRAFYPNVELKCLGFSASKIKEIDHFVSEIMYSFYKSDVFCKNWSNILWDKKKLRQKYNPKNLICVKDLGKEKNTIRYNGYLRAITEILFFYWDNLGHEIHGPYKMESGEILLIREWHDLRPDYFDFPENFVYDYICIYELYKPGTDIKIDISNRVYINSRIDECLIGFYVETADKLHNFSETLSIIKKIEKFCDMGVKEIVSLKSVQILEKAAYMHFYLLKPLTDILGISWKPNEECMARVKEGITENDKKPFKILIRLNLNEAVIKQLFDCRLKIPSVFYE